MNGSALTPERRKHLRFPVTLRCWCEAPSVTMLITMEDISEGGCRLKTAIPLLVGQTATLSWKIDGDKEIIAEVEVVWRFDATHSDGHLARRPGMGVRILRVCKGVDELLSFLTEIKKEAR